MVEDVSGTLGGSRFGEPVPEVHASRTKSSDLAQSIRVSETGDAHSGPISLFLPATMGHGPVAIPSMIRIIRNYNRRAPDSV